MSNQEAIALLRNLEDSLDSYCGLNEEGKTAFRMAIEALSCSEFPNSSDLISRQAAIDALDCINGTEEVLRSLPSAQPELIAQDAYVRGFEQGRTQGSVDAKLQPIHCKECRYFGDLYPWSADHNGFCHKAMKKEEFFL